MGLFLHLALLLLFEADGFPEKNENSDVPYELICSMESHVILSCTYNCSSGWVRANWQSDYFVIFGNLTQDGDLCALSLIINMTRTTNKTYKCVSEETDNTQMTSKTLRQVLVQFGARPSAPVLSPVVVSPRETLSEPMEMTCAAGGFYPKEVKVTWFLNGIMLKEATDETTGPAADGTFSVLSRITLSPSVSVLRDAVVCEIQHQALSQPLRTNASIDRKHIPVRVYYSRVPGGPDEVLDLSNTIRTQVGAFLRLRCFAEGKNLPAVQWYKKNITATLWLNINNGTTMTLEELNEENAGVYKCQTPIYTYIFIVAIERPGTTLWLKVLAAVMVSVVAVLAVSTLYLCLSCKQRRREQASVNSCRSATAEDKVTAPTPAQTVINGLLDTRLVLGSTVHTANGTSSETVSGGGTRRWENVKVKVTEADCQSEHEVPYADIIISVRGSSTPELSNVIYAPKGDCGKRWQEELGLSPLLQVSRSADRLHVQQREVTRKMSTTSEYAVISYYPETMA